MEDIPDASLLHSPKQKFNIQLEIGNLFWIASRSS